MWEQVATSLEKVVINTLCPCDGWVCHLSPTPPNALAMVSYCHFCSPQSVARYARVVRHYQLPAMFGELLGEIISHH